ncbi:putative amine oxidase, partial [Corchorus olitorius]
TLTDMLANDLSKDELKLKSKVLSLSYGPDGKSTLENWSLSLMLLTVTSILKAPLANAKEMKITKGGKLFPLNFIPEVSYMPLSVIITTFKKENVKKPLEGFGVLVPSKEQQNGLKTLGNALRYTVFVCNVSRSCT